MKLYVMSLSMVLALVGCDSRIDAPEPEPGKVSADELAQFVQQAKSNLIFVEGGEFLMGDFGTQYAPERLPYDADKDSKPLHRVVLSSYSLVSCLENKYSI